MEISKTKDELIKATCDFCGVKTVVERTHYGSGFGYVRLICLDCQKKLGAKTLKKGEIENEIV